MDEFASWQSYFDFARSVKWQSRYVFEQHVETFLQAVLATSEKRLIELAQGSYLWRAQQGSIWRTVQQDGDMIEIPFQFPPERMKPLSDSAREGRANPKGIPCLYLARDKETAMAEVRPWIGSHISVGQFKTIKQLLLVDCSVKGESHIVIHFSEPEPSEREKAVWKDIDRAFSVPINPDDSTADYAPTQILAEAFRSHGYDGVAYTSAMGNGLNIALFDISTANLVTCHLYEVKTVAYEFHEIADPYFNSNE